ncbi:MAG: tail fiber domain-containing protein [Phycisphaerales bacterium]|nr:MAG: tail fiber domain-containing protein [Phycisphaerales bacterium]
MRRTRELVTVVSVVVLGLFGSAWAENGEVAFRGTVTVGEQHDVVPVCYGDYFVEVEVDEVLADPNAAFGGVTTVEVCYADAHDLEAGDEVEVYGYYWGGTCPRQYCGRVAASDESYYIELASLIDSRTAFTYQGRLTESGGAADGLYDFRFVLYDHPDPGAGTQVGEPYYADEVDVTDGYFTVLVNFGAEVFDGEPRWLEVAVKPALTDMLHVVLEPRQQITPTPYAIHASSGGSGGGGGGDGAGWAISGDDLYSVPPGNVGIGTSAPTEKLHVVGNVRIEGTSPAWLHLIAGLGDDAGVGFGTAGIGSNWWEVLRDGSSSDFLIRESFPYPPFTGASVAIEAGTGNVGIGTTSPTAKLVVVGGTKVLTADSGIDNGLRIYNTDGSMWYGMLGWYGNNLKLQANGGRDVKVVNGANKGIIVKDVSGRVGIGTTDPAAPLHVQKEGAGRQLAAYFNNPTDGADSEVEIQFGLGKMLPSGWSLKASSGLFNIANVAVFPPALSISSVGKVGIGTTEPFAQLDVRRPGAGRQLAAYFANPSDAKGSEVEVQFGVGTALPSGWSMRATSGSFTIGDVAVFPPAVTVRSTGNVGIGDTDPTYRLELPNVAGTSGRGRANSWVTYSSRRWKTNIRPIDDAMEKVKQMRGVYFDWQADGRGDIGMVAEEVGAVVPEVVDYEENGTDARSLAYGRLVAVLVEALKEQEQRIAELEEAVARNEELERRVRSLELAAKAEPVGVGKGVQQ